MIFSVKPQWHADHDEDDDVVDDHVAGKDFNHWGKQVLPAAGNGIGCQHKARLCDWPDINYLWRMDKHTFSTEWL